MNWLWKLLGFHVCQALTLDNRGRIVTYRAEEGSAFHVLAPGWVERWERWSEFDAAY